MANRQGHRVQGLRIHRASRASRELELELIQSHMAQKPMLRGEVGARALRSASIAHLAHLVHLARLAHLMHFFRAS
jgi:hypothetical protein